MTIRTGADEVFFDFGNNVFKNKKGEKIMIQEIIVIYEKYLDRIWGDLSEDDKIRLEGHFNGLINELGDYREELSKVTKKERNNE